MAFNLRISGSDLGTILTLSPHEYGFDSNNKGTLECIHGKADHFYNR